METAALQYMKDVKELAVRTPTSLATFANNTETEWQRISPDSNLVAFGGIDIEAPGCQPLVVTTCCSYGEPPNQFNGTALNTSIHLFECYYKRL